jgi:hypothetical protein
MWPTKGHHSRSALMEAGSRMRFCTICGFMLSGTPRFCGGCGSPLAQALDSEPLAAPPVLAPGQGPPRWGRPDTPDRPRWDPQDYQTGELPASHGTTPYQFGDLFAPDRPRAVPPIPYAPAEGLVPDYIPPSGRRRPGGRGMTIFAIVTTIVVLAAGSAAAWRLISHRPGLNAATAPPRSPSAASSAAASSAAASSSGVSRPPADRGTVAIAPAAARAPHVQQAAALLTAYFSSINSHDFEAYNGLFVPQIRGSLQHFNDGYASTTDSAATLVGLSAAGQQDLAATVTFTSRQNPADSPDHAACDTWTVVIPLTRAGAGYLIGRSPPGYRPSVRACA